MRERESRVGTIDNCRKTGVPRSTSVYRHAGNPAGDQARPDQYQKQGKSQRIETKMGQRQMSVDARESCQGDLPGGLEREWREVGSRRILAIHSLI